MMTIKYACLPSIVGRLILPMATEHILWNHLFSLVKMWFPKHVLFSSEFIKVNSEMSTHLRNLKPIYVFI